MKKLLTLTGAALVLSSSFAMATNSHGEFRSEHLNSGNITTETEFTHYANSESKYKNDRRQILKVNTAGINTDNVITKSTLNDQADTESKYQNDRRQILKVKDA